MWWYELTYPDEQAAASEHVRFTNVCALARLERRRIKIHLDLQLHVAEPAYHPVDGLKVRAWILAADGSPMTAGCATCMGELRTGLPVSRLPIRFSWNLDSPRMYPSESVKAIQYQLTLEDRTGQTLCMATGSISRTQSVETVEMRRHETSKPTGHDDPVYFDPIAVPSWISA